MKNEKLEGRDYSQNLCGVDKYKGNKGNLDVGNENFF